MAKLTSGNLTVEMRLRELDEDRWVQYDIFFLYKDQPIIQDHLLKRVTVHWSRRSPGAFKVNEHEGEAGGLIPTLRKALETDEMQYYETLEPDFILAIYPKMDFPFMDHRYEPIPASEHALEQERQHEPAREDAGGKLPDDPFTIIFFIDLYNFGDEHAYTREGPALIMSPTRAVLRQFLDDFEQEFHAFCRSCGLSSSNDQST